MLLWLLLSPFSSGGRPSLWCDILFLLSQGFNTALRDFWIILKANPFLVFTKALCPSYLLCSLVSIKSFSSLRFLANIWEWRHETTNMHSLFINQVSLLRVIKVERATYACNSFQRFSFFNDHPGINVYVIFCYFFSFDLIFLSGKRNGFRWFSYPYVCLCLCQIQFASCFFTVLGKVSAGLKVNIRDSLDSFLLV